MDRPSAPARLKAQPSTAHGLPPEALLLATVLTPRNGDCLAPDDGFVLLDTLNAATRSPAEATKPPRNHPARSGEAARPQSTAACRDAIAPDAANHRTPSPTPASDPADRLPPPGDRHEGGKLRGPLGP